MKAHLVVMAGGSGTRFWPKSTAARPKQLLNFGREGQQTLLAETLARFDALIPSASRWIVTTERLSFEVSRQAGGAMVLAEPQGRNTAPCLYWAAREIASIDPDSVMVVMPSDHAIADLIRFRETVSQAIEWARHHDDLVTLGVKPTRPETGYGYLKLGSRFANEAAIAVERFVEKPSRDRAEEFFRSGQYLWNGGMFVWKTSVILAAFDRHLPEMRKAWDAAGGDIAAAYAQATATSIDYGVLEKSTNVVTFELDCGWDDLGSWTSLESLADRLQLRDPAGTVAGGQVIAVRSAGNIIDAPGRVVALLGVQNLIIVAAGDTWMIAAKDSAQEIRQLVDAVKQVRPDLV